MTANENKRIKHLLAGPIYIDLFFRWRNSLPSWSVDEAALLDASAWDNWRTSCSFLHRWVGGGRKNDRVRSVWRHQRRWASKYIRLRNRTQSWWMNDNVMVSSKFVAGVQSISCSVYSIRVAEMMLVRYYNIAHGLHIKVYCAICLLCVYKAI